MHDQHRAQAITALLGSDELTSFALDSWTKNLPEKQAAGETSPPLSVTRGDLVPDLIQTLFDLLPALRAAKQTYCILLAEINVEAETVAEGGADVLTAASGVGASRDS